MCSFAKKPNSMDRRQALKIMGLSLGAAFMADIAPLANAAIRRDNQSSKKRLIFYFTATGNSLFVARQLSDNLLSIPQELKKSNLSYSADEIGFVFPDYAASAPMIVRDFLSKAKFNAPYMFSVITYGNASVNVAEWWNNFAQEKGVKFNYIKSILMVDNYLPVFDMNDQMRIDKHFDANLAAIVDDISGQKSMIESADMGFFNVDMLKNMQDQHFSMTADRLVQIDQNTCIQCMTCARVCPHKNFSVADGKLVAAGKCEYCLACIQNCPQKALSLERERNKNARFRNPNVSLNDIIKSNEQ